MTTAGVGSTPTALDLLFGPDADAVETLAGEILSPGGDQNLGRALAHLSDTTRKVAVREAATTMAALLKVDLISVLVCGWREYRDIVSAARRTLAAPGSTELVSMSAHEVTVDQRPSVSVLVDGKRVATLELGLSIVFNVDALLLGISGGRLFAVHSGSCDITATLTVQDTDLLTRRGHLELPGVISLRQRIRLLPTGEYPVGEHPDGEYLAGEYTGSEPRGGERPDSERPDGGHPASGRQGSGYPANKDDPTVPWWQSARSVPPQDRRT